MSHHRPIRALVLALGFPIQAGCARDSTADDPSSKHVEGVAHVVVSACETPFVAGHSLQRLAWDPCKLSRRNVDSLESALADFGALDRWPVSVPITWRARPGWLILEDTARTNLIIELIDDSATNMVVHAPGVPISKMCQPKVTFEAEVAFRTDDGVVDTRARGEFTAIPSKTVANLTTDLQPVVPAAPSWRRSILLKLDIPHVPGAVPEVEFRAREVQIVAGQDGRPTIGTQSEEVLGSSVEPSP